MLTFRLVSLNVAVTILVTACGGTGTKAGPDAPPDTPPEAAIVPTMTPAGGTFTSVQTVTISDATPGALIYYTVNGSTPDSSSSVYVQPLSVATTGVIKAIAIASGYTTSPIASDSFTITPAAAPSVLPIPIISPNGGALSAAELVTLSDSVPAAIIHYTLDGTAPNAASTIYSAALSVSTTANLQAIALAPGYADSAVASAQFTADVSAPVILPAPSITPAGGTFGAALSVALTDANASAILYYTLDGSAPTASSLLYHGLITIGTTTTVRAIALSTGAVNSPIATAVFTINSTPLPTPQIVPASGTLYGSQTVVITDANSGATIHYTLDGSNPTSASAAYAGGIALVAGSSPKTITINAIAVATGSTSSAVASGTITIAPAVSGSPVYSFDNVQIVGGGFVTGLFFHPTQQGLMYARTDVGGAYRWDVGGGDTAWVPLTDFIGRFNNGNDAGVESLALDPNDSTRLYLAIGEYSESWGSNGAIIALSNRGKTIASSVALPIKMGSNDTGRGTGERLSVDSVNGHHLYFGSRNNGLYESTDQAASWHQVTAFPVTAVDATNAEDPEIGVIFEEFVAANGTAANGNAKTVYVGVSSSGTATYMPLYVSNDGGTTFSPVPGQPTGYWPNKASLDAANGILYVTYGRYNATPACLSACYNTGPTYVNSGQVWKYLLPTNANPIGTWTNITPPQTTPTGTGEYGYGSVAVDPEHPNVVMVTTMNKYYPPPYDDIFRSVDSGATWVNIGTNATRDSSLSPWINFGAASAGSGNWLNHIAVDPFDSNHVMYGSGQTVWVTRDMTAADGVATSSAAAVHANATAWAIGALGIEETVVQAIASPASGPISLISAVDDLGGFTHTNLNASPTNGSWRTGDGASIDVAQAHPASVVRIGSLGGNGASTLASYSPDGGLTWIAFPMNPAGVTAGQGSVAIAADGTSILWQPSDAGVAAAYTANFGTTWAAATGIPAQVSSGSLLTVLADRVNPLKFYVFDPHASGGGTPIYLSVDGGHTFSSAGTPSTTGNALIASPAADGDVWELAGTGLYHSTDSGATFSAIPAVKISYGLGFGMAAPGYTYPTLFLVGQTTADAAATDAPCSANTSLGLSVISNCLYRSVDGGVTWARINDFQHQWSRSSLIIGDPRMFGRFYLATPGRGIIEGNSPN